MAMEGNGDGSGAVTRPGSGMLAWLGQHRALAVAGLAGALAFAVFVLVWYEPQKLLIDERVNEALPAGAGAAAEPMADEEMAPEETAAPMADEASADEETAADDEEMADDETAADAMTESADASSPAVLAAGEFTGTAHPTSGTAQAIELEDGTRILRLEGFETDNGPDLLVYLSSAAPDAGDDAFDDDFIDLGALKGNIGDQNYELSADVDLERYATVVIWCRRFTVSFGTAQLQAPT